MAWIETHQSLLKHPKTALLIGHLQTDRYKVVGHLVALWCWSLDVADDDGKLPAGTSDIAVADGAGWPIEDAKAFVKGLRTAGFLEKRGYQLHDWGDYTWRYNAGKDRSRSDGELGNHERWHVRRGKSQPGCPYCAGEGGSTNGVKRRGRLNAAKVIGTHSDAEWQQMTEAYGGCLVCGAEDVTKDHIIPVYAGGSDSIQNIQPLCRRCNSSKGGDKTDYRISHPQTKPEWIAPNRPESPGESHLPSLPPTLPTESTEATSPSANGHKRPAAESPYNLTPDEWRTVINKYPGVSVQGFWREWVEWIEERESERRPKKGNLIAFSGFVDKKVPAAAS